MYKKHTLNLSESDEREAVTEAPSDLPAEREASSQ